MGAANAIAYTLGTSVLITAIAIAIAIGIGIGIGIGTNVLPRRERRRDRERDLRLPSARRRSSCSSPCRWSAPCLRPRATLLET